MGGTGRYQKGKLGGRRGGICSDMSGALSLLMHLEHGVVHLKQFHAGMWHSRVTACCILTTLLWDKWSLFYFRNGLLKRRTVLQNWNRRTHSCRWEEVLSKPEGCGRAYIALDEVSTLVAASIPASTTGSWLGLWRKQAWGHAAVDVLCVISAQFPVGGCSSELGGASPGGLLMASVHYWLCLINCERVL